MTFFRTFFMISMMIMAGLPALAEMRRSDASLAIPAPTTSAAILSEARAPIGWTDFCRRHPAECTSATIIARPVLLTKSSWAMISRTNTIVNAGIRQAEDINVYGVAEYWDYPARSVGDCEDFALQKRKILIALGVPREALLMTVVRDHEGLGHAVLTVVTDKGDFILDNKIDTILPWADTGYSFVKRQSRTRTDQWVRIGEPSTLAITAAGQ